MECDLSQMPAFGVAGNFTGHLEQAGEAKDFARMTAVAEGAPKAVFPTYVPPGCGGKAVPAFLRTFPFDEQAIAIPPGEQKVQLEPECGVLFALDWEGERVASVRALSFCASNDCSIRRDGARKISEKKNWGACSKGAAASRVLTIDRFAPGGILDRYRIASFLVRGGTVHPYGEDSPVRSYSYCYERLADWLVRSLNDQRDEGPAEAVGSYLVPGKPLRAFVSIGATRYTDFGEHTFLAEGDIAAVVLYPEDAYRAEDIARMAAGQGSIPADVSLLRQRVIRR